MDFRKFFAREPQPESYIKAAAEGYRREADQVQTIRSLSQAIAELRAVESLRISQERSQEEELRSALRMAGDGPWLMPKDGALSARESLTPGMSAQGAYGDIELALQNVAWRREINGSWMEFSRWGIQQIILISRLYFVKNPLIRRGTKVSAFYVFGRGVQISSDDKAQNETIQAFLDRNQKTLGQSALTELEERKWYDGNLFFVLFSDRETGDVDVRTIDATEIQEIVTDPEDADTPWFYQRLWTQRNFDENKGTFENVTMKAWYPAMGYEPDAKPAMIGDIPVRWESPVYHRKCGGVAKWRFGCPEIYPALDWARAVLDWLQACMTVRQALSQFAMTLTTKGGQQAMQGAKQQLSTTVGPSNSLWDQNPTATDGSIFVSGTGTKLEAFKTTGAGGNPDDCRQYKLMVCMVFGLPESFFADMNTSNLATATSLDRPTELNFIGRQEQWKEDLKAICLYVLRKSVRAPGGKLREAKRAESNLSVNVEFPAIIQADLPANVSAVVQAMTLGSRRGGVEGIDEKEGVRLLYNLLGVKGADELLEKQFPTNGPDAYDPKRTSQDDPEAQNPTGPTIPSSGRNKVASNPDDVTEALRKVISALKEAGKRD
jgi:hypothetical protein